MLQPHICIACGTVCEYTRRAKRRSKAILALIDFPLPLKVKDKTSKTDNKAGPEHCFSVKE